MTSCRAIWSLMYAGVKDVSLLDGGFKAWQENGGATVSNPREPQRIATFSRSGKCESKYLATLEEVIKITVGQKGKLVDVR